MFPELHKWDLIGKLFKLLHPNGPYIIDPDDGKIKKPDGSLSISWNTPWVHIMPDPDRHCHMYTEIFVGCLDMIPKKCMNCWKVVFRPQYLKDMLNLIPLMTTLYKKHHFHSKLGYEGRPWTSGEYGKFGLWGCYFYNNSRKVGEFCWRTVKDAIASDDNLKHLLDDVDEDGYPIRLVLKRGCTEFEVGKFGDSKNWTYTEENEKWENIVWANVEEEQVEVPQPDCVINHVISEWFKYAHHAGDPTVKEFNEGTMLWRSTRYYHKDGGKK